MTLLKAKPKRVTQFTKHISPMGFLCDYAYGFGPDSDKIAIIFPTQLI
jgi:hypothetical protein